MKQELEAALAAAAMASGVIRKAYALLDAKSSAPADITTQTDRDSQETILQALAAAFPNDAFRAEENTPTLAKLTRDGARVWIIDPIDGTRGFVMKNGEFSVMIALCVDGEAVAGVVTEPAFERTTFAARDLGCWQEAAGGPPRRVNVSATTSLAAATLIQSHTRGVTREVEILQPAKVIETYSAGVKLARVADGSADLYVCDYAAMNDWDLAAGHALVTVAGGRVSNLAGEPRVYGQGGSKQYGGLLASNGTLHRPAVERLPNAVRPH